MKIGDVVQLKSGGLFMTVIRIREGQVDCCWMHDGDCRSSLFPVDALNLKPEPVRMEPLTREVEERIKEVLLKTR